MSFDLLIRGAHVVPGDGPAARLDVGVADGRIAAVEPDLSTAEAAEVVHGDGLLLCPGFIDAHADLGVGEVPQGGDVGPTHWNPQVRAWFSTTSNLKDDTTRRAALRSLGFGTALVVPKNGILSLST